MNKTELVKAVAGETGLTQADAGKAIDAALDTIHKSLKSDEQVAIAGFGTFVAKHRPARDGRNPRTGETVKIAARTSAAFKPATALKNL
jgi:DNA-binding protein HU-beta